MTEAPLTQQWLERYEHALLGVFGRPQLVLDHGEGAWVWDVDGRRYLDLVGGIAVNALGHGHPALVAAVSTQAARLVHVSNLHTTAPQVELAERILRLAGAPEGSAVFFTNSGTEAVEAAVKLARRTGRRRPRRRGGRLPRADHRRAGADPQAGLPRAVRAAAPRGDPRAVGRPAALRHAVTGDTAAVVLEPLQGEAGVLPPAPGFLQAAREATRDAGALLVLDEVQTGVGRTGAWFAFQEAGVLPDAMTLAKGLGGGVPVGALVTFGPGGRPRCSGRGSTARPSAATRSRAPPAWPCSTPSSPRACSRTCVPPASTSPRGSGRWPIPASPGCAAPGCCAP